MKRIECDMEDILSLREKEKLLKDLNQSDLIDLFKKNYKPPTYKPSKPKQVSLDHQVNIAIAKTEKELIAKELLEIKKAGPPISVSAFLRSRALSPIDIGEWYQKAVEGLQALSTNEYNEKELLKEKSKYIKMLEHLDEDDDETMFAYSKKIREISGKIEELKRTKPKRIYRLSGRVTFNESNIIKWRAARLSLSAADYLRFVVFNYLPFSDADKHLTINDRKRFYISIMEVYKNGWGDPPTINECPNCERYINDIKNLREQLARYQKLSK